VTVTVELDLDLALEAPLVLEGLVRIGQSEHPRTGELQELDLEIKIERDDEPDNNNANEET
jgi:hypothetical protein